MGRSSAITPTPAISNRRAQAGEEAEAAEPHDINSGFPYIERRSQKRRRFTAAATALDPDSGTRIEALTTDICLRGCYVETMNALPTGTAVVLRLTKDGKSLRTMAKVAHSQIFVGMGLEFSEVEHGQLLLLEEWIAELRGE